MKSQLALLMTTTKVKTVHPALMSRAVSLAWRNNSSEVSHSVIKIASQILIQSRSGLVTKVLNGHIYEISCITDVTDNSSTNSKPAEQLTSTRD